MSAKSLLECTFCEKIMNDPFVLPCGCFICMKHVETLKTNNNTICCKECKKTFHQESLLIHLRNKKLKASIENEEYLTDIEKRIKSESKELLNELQLITEGLVPRENNQIELIPGSFDNLRKEIDKQAEWLKEQIDTCSTELKYKLEQLKEELTIKVKGAGKQVGKLRSDHEKKSSLLEDLFRRSNTSIEAKNEYKNGIEKIIDSSYLLKKQFDQLCNEILSLTFNANKNFSEESFGSINSKLNLNLTRFESENVEETNFASDNVNINHEPTSVSSTNNPDQIDTRSVSNMNQSVSYDTCNDTTRSNGENEVNSDFNINYDKSFEESNEKIVSFSRSNSKSNGGFIVINLDTFETILKGDFDCKSWCSQVFQDDKIFIGTSGGSIKLVSLHDPKTCYQKFSGNSKQRINCLKVILNKNDYKPRLVSGHQDNLIKVWDISTAECLHTLIGHHSWINCIEYLPDGNLISGSNDGTIKVWSLINGTLIRTLTREPSNNSFRSLSIYCMQLLDNQRVACGSGDGYIEIWDYERGKCLSKSNLHSKHIWQLGLTPTGELISSSGDMTIKTWLIEENKLKYVRDLGEHDNEPCSFIIKEDGILVSGSCDGFKKFDLYEDTLLEIMNFEYISDHPQIQFVSI